MHERNACMEYKLLNYLQQNKSCPPVITLLYAAFDSNNKTSDKMGMIREETAFLSARADKVNYLFSIPTMFSPSPSSLSHPHAIPATLSPCPPHPHWRTGTGEDSISYYKYCISNKSIFLVLKFCNLTQ